MPTYFKCSPEGQYYYPVKIDGQVIDLPGKIVGPDGKRVRLAWLRPELAEICQPGAAEMTKILTRLIGSLEEARAAHILLLTPPSSKSGTMMELVAEQLNEAMQQQNPKSEVNLFNAFVKGDTEAEVRKKLGLTAHDQDFEYVEYQPITSPVTKILGVRKSKLKKVLEQHEQFFIVDDVYSTGATIDAIKKLMIKVGGQSAREKIQTVTLAREVDAEKFEQQSLSESGVHSVIKIPTELVD